MFKQVIVVRKDLKMGIGKLCTQCCHASLGAVKKANEDVVKKWEKEGGKKVVLKVKNLGQLKRIYEKCKKAKIPCFLVRDAGLTQLRRGSITTLGIGPAKEEIIDRITGKLKLL